MYKLNPDGFDADSFLGKRVAVYTKQGKTIGMFDGYDYDYNDDDEQVIEISVTPDGESLFDVCFDSDEDVEIEILD